MTTTTNGRRITTHEATVKTATVEIKSLQISGKQVTLAVFRQLKEEPIVSYATAELRGVPWGTVNYHPGTCEYLWEETEGGEHLHVVWQKGNELRRSAVFRHRRRHMGPEEEIAAEVKVVHDRCVALATAILCHRVLQGVPLQRNSDGKRYDISDETRNGYTWHIEPSFLIDSYLDPETRDRTYYLKRLEQEMLARARQAAVVESPESWLSDLQGLGQRYRVFCERGRALAAREDQIEARFQQQYAALESLDQLFIAV